MRHNKCYDFKVDAEVVLIAPDNGHRGPGKQLQKVGIAFIIPKKDKTLLVHCKD